jgi:flavin reductase
MTEVTRPPAPTIAAEPGAPDAAGLAFREGMSRLPAAVNLVTTDGPAGLAGFTATAVASVSDHPPTLLVCMIRTAQTRERLFANGVFCVNTLPADAAALADVFAGRTGLHLEERFAHGSWGRLATGAPVLETAAVSFDCRLTEVKDVATHHVLFGEVLAVRAAAEQPGLVWVHRGYRSV